MCQTYTLTHRNITTEVIITEVIVTEVLFWSILEARLAVVDGRDAEVFKDESAVFKAEHSDDVTK